MVKNIIFTVVAVVVLVLGMNFPVNGTTVVKEMVGASSGPEVYNHQYFLSGMTDGGGVTATSTSGSVVPLLARDFDDESVVDVTLNVSDATLSFPASTTITVLPRVGDRKTFLVRNASTTATMDITMTGGTGILLKKATSSAVLTGDTDGANFGVFVLTRKANSDIEALYTPFTD